MGSKDGEAEGADWAGIIRGAIEDVGDEEDGERLNVLSSDGLSGAGEKADSNELPYVVLLQAAVSMVKSGEISFDEFVEGVSKLDVIANSALKIYAIPAVKNDLPGKLTEHQNQIVDGLEDQVHVLKEGLAMLLLYPQSQAIDDLETGLQTAVQALHTMAEIQKNAREEYAAIMQREKEEKAARAKRAAGVGADSDSDS